MHSDTVLDHWAISPCRFLLIGSIAEIPSTYTRLSLRVYICPIVAGARSIIELLCDALCQVAFVVRYV